MNSKLTPVMIKKINRFLRKRKYDPFDSHVEAVVCLKCGLVMNDQEPGNPVPEFYHARDPKRYCPNETKEIHPGVPGIAPFRRKSDRRVRHAGAKKAGKLFRALKNKQ